MRVRGSLAVFIWIVCLFLISGETLFLRIVVDFLRRGVVGVRMTDKRGQGRLR